MLESSFENATRLIRWLVKGPHDDGYEGVDGHISMEVKALRLDLLEQSEGTDEEPREPDRTGLRLNPLLHTHSVSGSILGMQENVKESKNRQTG